MKKPVRIISHLGHLARNEQGGTLAELAIVLPFLIVMVATTAEVGRFFQSYTTLSKSTRSAARYLSNHQFNNLEKDRAKNLVVCGKLSCATGEELVKGLSTSNVCIQTTLTPSNTVETITVSLPRTTSMTCEDGGTATQLLFDPIFNIGALLNNDTFDLAYPLAPSTTMRYIPAD